MVSAVQDPIQVSTDHPPQVFDPTAVECLQDVHFFAGGSCPVHVAGEVSADA